MAFIARVCSEVDLQLFVTSEAFAGTGRPSTSSFWLFLQREINNTVRDIPLHSCPCPFRVLLLCWENSFFLLWACCVWCSGAWRLHSVPSRIPGFAGSPGAALG